MPARRYVLSLSILFTILAAIPQVAGQDARQPVPNSSKQGPVLARLKEDYKAEYAKREAADQLALANTFLNLASQATPGDPVKQYVLLREARELAVNGGDLRVAFSAIDRMSHDFAIDGNELKVSAMSGAISRSKAPPMGLFNQYLSISDQALDEGDLQMAYQASRLATKLARESRDPGSIARAHQTELHINEVNRHVKLVIAAADKLKAHPDDPDANLMVGQYWCFLRGLWDEGLPHLAKGSDSQMAELAKEDLATPQDASGMMKLADDWWKLPDTPQTPQRRSWQRAVHWYELALPQLKDNDKQKAEQRVAAKKTPSE